MNIIKNNALQMGLIKILFFAIVFLLSFSSCLYAQDTSWKKATHYPGSKIVFEKVVNFSEYWERSPYDSNIFYNDPSWKKSSTWDKVKNRVTRTYYFKLTEPGYLTAEYETHVDKNIFYHQDPKFYISRDNNGKWENVSLGPDSIGTNFKGNNARNTSPSLAYKVNNDGILKFYRKPGFYPPGNYRVHFVSATRTGAYDLAYVQSKISLKVFFGKEDNKNTGLTDPDTPEKRFKITGNFQKMYLLADISAGEDFGRSIKNGWSNLLVIITSPNGKKIFVRTDSDGNFEAKVKDKGKYLVEIEDCNIFSKSYNYSVDVPDGNLGTNYITDDMKMLSYMRVASSFKMLQASGLAGIGGSYSEVYKDCNGFTRDIHYIANKLDWSKAFNNNIDQAILQWRNKKWKYIKNCPYQHYNGQGLFDSIAKMIGSGLSYKPSPKLPQSISLEKYGSSTIVRGKGTFLFRDLKAGEKVICPNGTYVQNSIVLYNIDELGEVIYVLEGLVRKVEPGQKLPAALAVAGFKIVNKQPYSKPLVEPFNLKEAELLWQGKNNAAIQGSSFEASMDAYVYAYNYRNWNRSNRGKYDQLRAGWHPTGGESRTYIKFDLSSVDPSTVGKATLKLYHFQTTGRANIDLGVYRVTGPWEEGTDTYHSGRTEKTAAPGELSWVQQPTIDATPIATFNPGSGLYDWTEVNITPLVTAWLSGTPNYGLVIKPVNHGQESVYYFASRERKADLDKPKGKSKAPLLILSKQISGTPDNQFTTSNQTINISGQWTTSQSNGFTGTMTLQQDAQGRISGTTTQHSADGQVSMDAEVTGRVTGTRADLTFNYSWGQGFYTGTISADGNTIQHGKVSSNTGDTATWSAVRKRQSGGSGFGNGSYGNALGKPCASDKEFVRSLYQSILERDLDVSFTPGHGAAHLRDLQNGIARWRVIRNFFNAPEYRNKQKSHHDFIRDVYQAVLGREPQAKEINSWPRVDRNDILRKFFNSDEYLGIMRNCKSRPLSGLLENVTGKWKWFTDVIITISPDSTVTGDNGGRGVITAQYKNGKVEYLIKWGGGQYIDRLYLIDNNTLKGQNQNGTPVWGKRINADAWKTSNTIHNGMSGQGNTGTSALSSGTYSVEQGHWKSTWRLQVSNGRISGTSEWSCCPGHRIDRMSGTISGNSVVIERDCSGQGVNVPCHQTFKGTIAGDRITGSWISTGFYTGGGAWVLYLHDHP